MNRHRNTKNTDPSARTGNKSKTLQKAAGVAAVGVLIALATVHPGDKPNTVKTSYQTYHDAKKDLAKLAAAHGDESGDTPKKAEATINGSLEATVPLFKNHVSTTLSEISTEHNGGYFIVKDGNRYGFDFNSFVNDNKQRVDTLNMNVDGQTIYLAVTHKDDGDVDILYRDSNFSTDEGLSVEGSVIDSYSTLSTSNPAHTGNYTDAQVTHFKHDFYGSPYEEANAGSNLKLVDKQMQELDKVLSLANQAITNGHKEY